MVPPLLFDISGIDLEAVQFDAQAIERVNPHRGLMRLLDGVIWADDRGQRAVAYKQVRDDEFWVPGHIPGRPLFPGVLMIEAAAQLASFVAIRSSPTIKFVGFAGVDKVKFRGQVQPGDRFMILGDLVEFRSRRLICNSQGLVGGTVVFEAVITGMPM